MIPAAHSMDTVWFAVDADGCVGVFDSWEGGAVPLGAATVVDSFDELRLVPATEPRRQVVYDVPDGHATGAAVLTRIVVDDLAPFVAMLAAGEASWALASRGVAIVVVPDAALFRLLHEGGLCRGCESVEDRFTESHEATQLGLYAYEHPIYGSAEPYVREMRPSRPLLVEALPSAMRDAIAAVRLPLRFAEQSSVQPRGLVKSHVWGSDDDE
jgi:hypothetical protein